MSIEIDIEFKVNDSVTFKPYKTAIKAKIIKIYRGFGFKDNRVVYVLSGISQPLISHCTGNSIVESKYYKCLEVC